MDWSEIVAQGFLSAVPALIVGWAAYTQTERIRKDNDRREAEAVHRRTTGLLIAVMRELDMLLENAKDRPYNAERDGYPVAEVVAMIRGQYGDLDVELSNLVETGYGNYAHFISIAHRTPDDWKIAVGSLHQAFEAVKAELARRGKPFS